VDGKDQARQPAAAAEVDSVPRWLRYAGREGERVRQLGLDRPRPEKAQLARLLEDLEQGAQ
jgi:hypothetical protein